MRTTLAVVSVAIGMIACVDHVAGPSPDIPISTGYPSVASAFTEQGASASDSRVPTITLSGDSVLVTLVTSAICGRDTVMAGAARDSLVVTLRRTLLPLPCAFLLPDVRVRSAVAVNPHPRIVILSVQRFDFTDTTRALVASAVLGTTP